MQRLSFLWAALALALLGTMALCGDAAAAVRLCVELESDDNADGLRKLLLAELGHHPTHQVVAADCQSMLHVELFGVAGARYLTARINREVPVRYTVKNAADLPERLGEAVRLVLGHDPVYLLEDPRRYNAVQRTALALLKRGRNRYRISAMQVVAATGANAAFAAGGAFEVTRGIDHIQILARLYGAGAVAGASLEQRALRFIAGGDLGLLYEASVRSNTTFYLGPGLGLMTMQINGWGDAEKAVGSALKVDAALSGRVGVRFLRQHNFDFDVFAIGYLPLTNAQDVDSPLPKAYTPSVQIGLGVGF